MYFRYFHFASLKILEAIIEGPTAKSDSAITEGPTAKKSDSDEGSKKECDGRLREIYRSARLEVSLHTAVTC